MWARFALLTPAMLAVASNASGEAEPPPAPRPTTPQLVVMTYNVNYGTNGRDETLAAIAAGHADLVLLQETTPSWEKALRKRFADAYPHMVFRHDDRAAGGFAVLSRNPIRNEIGLPPPPGAFFPAQTFTVDTPLGALDVLHVHLRPAIVGGSWIKGYFETPPIRRREIEAHWKRLARKPAIVAGDFNEEPGKAVEQFLSDKGLHRIPTGGKPTTWSWSGEYQGRPVELAFDIDHVVIAGSLAAKHAHVLAGGKSDHRAVVVTLAAARK